MCLRVFDAIESLQKRRQMII